VSRGYLGLTVHDWLETLAAEDPVPGSGSAAAMTAATAAAVVAMTARLSPAGGGIAAQALALRSRLVGRADVSADVYAASLEALASATGEGDERRDFALGTALEEAAQAPLMIAESAADVALLAATAATIVKPEVQADARAAAALAAGAASAAAHLVDVNLASAQGDARVRRAHAAAERAATAAREAAAGDSLQSGE
jgi:methenyltetrahydrofolate cyclohydrolase